MIFFFLFSVRPPCRRRYRVFLLERRFRCVLARSGALVWEPRARDSRAAALRAADSSAPLARSRSRPRQPPNRRSRRSPLSSADVDRGAPATSLGRIPEE